jgi:methyltransferase (TIGR00027 family)
VKDNSSKTGLGPTFQLAIEQLFPANERLLSDHTAFPVLPAFLRAFVLLLKAKPVRKAYFDLMSKKIPGIYASLLCRKRYITDSVTTSAKQGAISSAVIFGAGFDTLAYRIPELSSLKVFELDFPENIAGKKKRIEKIFGGIPDHVKLVSIDFNRQTSIARKQIRFCFPQDTLLRAPLFSLSRA